MRRSLLAAIAAALLIAPNVVAAGSTIAISPSSDLHYGGHVSFDTTVEKLKGYEYPMVVVRCFQGTTMVYSLLEQPDFEFHLGSGYGAIGWTSGAADCTGRLWAYVGLMRSKYERPLTDPVPFHVAP
jgi:hypothetical protein